MTNYLNSRFSVHAPSTEQYRSNWDRIFGPSRLDRAMIDRIRELHTKYEHRIFLLEQFEDLGSQSDILLAFSRLACTGDFVIEYDLRCVDGHTIYHSSDFPARNHECWVCDESVDLEDDMTFVLKTKLCMRGELK